MYSPDDADQDTKLQAIADISARVYAYIDTAQALFRQVSALAGDLEAVDADLRKALGALGAPAPSKEATVDAEADAYARLNTPVSDSNITQEQDERLLNNQPSEPVSSVPAYDETEYPNT